ncbi:TRAP transporter small permease [Ancylobacter sp. 6x-1]|uniref:TRAP transporter small permease protein n=1 Tax=Ancylobacter crimeensis TaxID=2579147 RepID=A0ABT0D5X4_9HYPH|nr:TRAP transporter small permease [Ancylobacter crimeensis]MCK0195342.1 TRAP transporter small permease [Ancylobacter crimeensis]
MENLDRLLHVTLLWIIGALIFAMMLVTFGQVIARYALANSLSWSEELGRYIFVWITFLGMAAAFQSRAHVALDFLMSLLPVKPSHALAVFNTLLVAIVGVTLLVGGISLMRFGLNQRSAALGIPMYYVYVVIPFSGAMLAYFALRATWKQAVSGKQVTFDEKGAL